MWLAAAVFSAVFGGLTAIRTGVVLVMAWLIVATRGKLPLLRTVRRRELCFLILSGIATGASWLCYYAAIQNGKVSVVVPVDKMSLLLTVGFSRVFLGEKLSRTAFAGLLLMVGGTLLMAVWA